MEGWWWVINAMTEKQARKPMGKIMPIAKLVKYLDKFYEKYHCFVYLLYYSAQWLWTVKDNYSPQ